MQATPDLLRTFGLFKGLSDPDLKYLCSNSVVKRYERRAVILQAGVRENKICMLFDGRLQGIDFTIDGKEVGLYFVEPGDYCGELCVFDSGLQPEHVISLNSSVVVLFASETIREVAGRNPEVILQLGNKLATRIRQMNIQRSLLSLPKVSQRVCRQLWLLVAKTEAAKAQENIENLPTHMEIAIMLNLSRETITRVFQQLQRKQIVSRVGPNKLVINKPELLKGIAEGSSDL
jgi:CRP/FNR family cyclic AMP-dependent transcriptional regulator